MLLIGRPLLLFALACVGACRPDALAATECREIQDREVAYLKQSHLQPGQKLDPTWTRQKIERGVAACLAGEIYTREDYRCITRAKTELEFSRCMAAAHEKLPRDGV